MTEAEKQALAIYEMICATSGDRPIGFNSVEEMYRGLAAWRAQNPALMLLRESGPEVQLAFLDQSPRWIQAESQMSRPWSICQTLVDAITIALHLAPKPLPNDLVLKLLCGYGQRAGIARLSFPIALLLPLLTKEQVTEEIRSQLRKIHLQFAPSPTGLLDPHSEKMRVLIGPLIRVEGEKEPDPGRGPWSQIVFDEVKQKEEVARAGWEGLLEHCRTLEQSFPSAKWTNRAREMVSALGDSEVMQTLLRWLALGPTPGQPREGRSPIEDSAYQKGVVWCVAQCKERDVGIAIGDFTLACLRKVPMLGAVSQKVGFAGVQALGSMETGEAVEQLTRLRAKVKYSVARRLIEKSLRQAAERRGLSVEELEDMSVTRYALNAEGVMEIKAGDAKAKMNLREDGKVGVVWQDSSGKKVKAAPSQVKKSFPIEVRVASASAKELEQAFQSQRARLESSLIAARSMPFEHWRKHFVEHPLLSVLGRRLIWLFNGGQGWERSGIWSDGEVHDVSGTAVDLAAAKEVRLWHPLSADAAEVQKWRERLFTAGIRQPFRQAFREFYQVTDDERQTRMYSNRFAGVLMRQHQLASLCRARGWDYRLMSTNFDGGNVPTKKLGAWDMHVEFHVDLPPDRNNALRDSAIGEQSGTGINLFIGSDQVRFYRDFREVAVDEVPAIVYSEVMRDIDLFTSVCAAGEDETWTDQGDRGTGVFSRRFDLQEYTAVVELRAEILSRVLPHTPVSDRCKIKKTYLEVRGHLGTYHIHLDWAAAGLVTESEVRWLKIPRKILDAVELDLTAIPIDPDYRTETIVRKACVLADDWKIDCPELVRQLMPE